MNVTLNRTYAPASSHGTVLISFSVMSHWLNCSAFSNARPLAGVADAALGRCGRTGKTTRGACGRQPVLVQHRREPVHPAAVLGGDGLRLLGVVQGVAAGLLDGQELAGVGVVLHVGVGLDDQRVAGHEAEPPAGHVEALAHAVQLDADVERAGRGQEAHRLAVEHQGGVGGVVDDDQVVGLGEGDHVLEELGRGARAGRVVGVVDDQRLGPLEHVGGHAGQVGQEAVLLQQRQVVDDAAEVLGVGAEHG